MQSTRRPFASALLLALAACGSASGPRVDAKPIRTELKLSVRDDQADDARAAFGLSDERATVLAVTFYDTPALELYAAGLVLRSRAGKKGADDTTVKVRPLACSTVAERWFALDGFKCEEDRAGAKSVESGSLTAKQDARAIDEVARGERSVETLFSESQRDFVRAYAPLAPDWGRLEPLGPIPAKTWEFQLPEVGTKLSAELWTLPDGRELLEISTKVARSDADGAAATLERALSSRGLDTSAAQETKTHTALECFARRGRTPQRASEH